MKQKIGEVGVDAGLLMVGDPCYFIGEDATIHERCKTWEQALKEVFFKDYDFKQSDHLDRVNNVYGLGIAVDTTHGDGSYPVYLETTKTGRRRLIVNLD